MARSAGQARWDGRSGRVGSAWWRAGAAWRRPGPARWLGWRRIGWIGWKRAGSARRAGCTRPSPRRRRREQPRRGWEQPRRRKQSRRWWKQPRWRRRRSRRLFRRSLGILFLPDGRDSIQEDIWQQRRARLDRVASQVGDAVLRQDILVDVEVARRLRAV